MAAEKELKSAITRAASHLDLGFKLKPQQEEALLEFTKGRDVFVSLPTGFGKSLCYTLIPSLFDLVRGVENLSIALVISPLIALMEEQVATISAMGISAVYISDKLSNTRTVKKNLRNGIYQLVFMSPEALFSSTRFRLH